MTEPSFETVVDPVDGTRWLVDLDFLGSRWRCRWGDGCVGILDEPAAGKEQGCCSVGAEMLDEDEARNVVALAATLDPEIFEHHADAAAAGVLDESRRHTRVVDGACVLFNHPGFAGGTGCALHLAALADGDDPIDWKPAVCWQLPLKVERPSPGTAVLRRWRRHDWGSGGETMAWCCTESHDDTPDEPDCYDAESPVAERLGTEVRALVGAEVAVEIRRRIHERSTGSS